jgi:signal transduction histidine kinase
MATPPGPGRSDLRGIEAAYREETRQLIAQRYPTSVVIFLALMAVAYGIEWLYFPERWWQLSLCYAAFVAIGVTCTGLLRRLPNHVIGATLGSSVAIAFALAAYLALVHGSAELCLLAMIGLLTGEVVQFPWGPRGQAVAAIGTVAAYLWALQVGAALTLPAPYGLFALGSHALMTIVGAQLLDSYRFAAFREAAEAAHHAAESARANAAKGEFLATVSHELRTPLHIIVGYTDLLLEEAFERPEEQRDALGRIHHNSRQLLDLIQSMLDLNRIEAGRISLRIEEFSIAGALESLRTGLPANWCKPGVTLAWDTTDGTTPMRSDRAKMEIILRNLIHNALKYTEVGSVTVSARPDPLRGRVDFTVADTGQGIHPEDLAIIFDMFRQGSNGGPPRGGGVGLGLYIVKRLSDALAGVIRVESQLGSGSQFTVSLPLQLREQ